MNKIYIVRTITTNDRESIYNVHHQWERIEGVYSSHESALARIEELHEKYRLQNLLWDFVHQECTIAEHELIP
jgi:hypothetical protein